MYGGSDGPVEIIRDSWFSKFKFNWDDLERRKIKAPKLGIPKLKKGEVCLDPSMDYEDTPIVPYEKSSEWCKDF